MMLSGADVTAAAFILLYDPVSPFLMHQTPLGDLGTSDYRAYMGKPCGDHDANNSQELY